MKVSYKWLQTYFDASLPSIEKIKEGITMHAFEIESVETHGADNVIDIKILPDRAHDCLSHRGIAREISTLFDIPVKKEFERDATVTAFPSTHTL